MISIFTNKNWGDFGLLNIFNNLKIKNMWYLIFAGICFIIFIYSAQIKSLKDFRNNLKPGDHCSVLKGNKFYKAEVEAREGNIFFLVVYDRLDQPHFNTRIHIMDIYPVKKY